MALAEGVGTGIGILIGIIVSSQSVMRDPLRDPSPYWNFSVAVGAGIGAGSALLGLCGYLAWLWSAMRRIEYRRRALLTCGSLAGALAASVTYWVTTTSGASYGTVLKTTGLLWVDGVISTLVGGAIAMVACLVAARVRAYDE